MTGRVCHVHGEYSASGACRWCEPEESLSAYHVSCDVPSVLADICPTPEEKLDEVIAGYRTVLGPLPKTLLDLAKEWEAKHPILPQVEFLTQTNPFANEEPRVWNFYGLNEDGTIIHDWWEEPRLNEQWAALRWERVARRWRSKHLTMLDLASGWGLFVVESMREHVEKLARSNPLLQDTPKEPTP